VFVHKFYEHFMKSGSFFTSWFSTGGVLSLIFTTIFSMPLFILWIGSYSMNLKIIDAFYVYAWVNSWYLGTVYWLIWVFYLVHVIVRGGGSYGTDSATDHGMTVLIVNFVIGATALVMQTVMADRLNFWYVKTQFHAGREVNEAKNNVWTYPASLGSTARSWYNYSDNKKDAQAPIEKAKAEEKTAKAKEENDDFSGW